jgi:hypothetical protein
MAATVREFLETYQLHQRLQNIASAWSNGEWPAQVTASCRVCGGRRPYQVWSNKVAGVGPGWGVYMLTGTCEECCTDRVLFWIEVNPREGWMEKAGQIPALPLPRVKWSVAAN